MKSRPSPASWQCLTSGERATQWHAEGSVGKDQLIAGTDRREHRSPFVDHLVHGLTVRGTDVGDARRDLERTLGIDEHGFSTRRQFALRGIHEVENGHVVAYGPQAAYGPLDVRNVHEQIGNEHDHAAAADEPRGLLEGNRRRRRAAGAGFLERSDNAAPLSIARAWRNRAANLRIEAHEPDGIALPEQQQRERGSQPLGIGELGEARRGGWFRSCECTELRAAPGHRLADVEDNTGAKVALFLVLLDEPPSGAGGDPP